MDSNFMLGLCEGSQKASYKNAIEQLFKILLSDPEKRALVLDFFIKEGLITNDAAVSNMKKYNDKCKNAEPTSNPKMRIESPSKLLRRRALQQLNDNLGEDADNDQENLKPINQILSGVTAFCEVKSNLVDRSEALKFLLRTLGATVRDTLTSDVTHVIFKDGSNDTYIKAKMLKVHLVSVLWLEAVRRHRCKVAESSYPVVGYEDLSENATTQEIEEVFENVHEEQDLRYRKRRLKKLSTNKTLTQRSDNSLSITCEQKDSTSDSDAELSQKLLKSCTVSSGKKRTTKSVRKIPKFDNDNDSTDDDVYMGNTNARLLKNSLELEKVAKIRSPLSQSDNSVTSMEITDDESSGSGLNDDENNMQLCISATDDSNNRHNLSNEHEMRHKRTHPNAGNVNDGCRRSLFNINQPSTSNNLTRMDESNITFRKSKNMSLTCLTAQNESSDSSVEVIDLVTSGSSDHDQITQNTERNDSENVTNINRTTKRKLYCPNRPIDESLFNWDKVAPIIEPPDISKGNKSKMPHVLSIRYTKKFRMFDRPRDVRKSKKIEKRTIFTQTNNKIIAKNPVVRLERIEESSKDKSKGKHATEELEVNPTNKRLKPTVNISKPDSSTLVRRSPRISKKTTPKKALVLSPRAVRTKPGKKPEMNFHLDVESCSRRSTLDFEEKPSRKQQNSQVFTQKSRMKRSGLVFTLFTKEDLKYYRQIVKKLGRFFVEDKVTKRTTHLVAASPGRSLNMLKAISRGCWIVEKEWLLRSMEAEKWLCEEYFEMTEFSKSVQRNRLDKQAFGYYFTVDIFRDCLVFVSRDSTPPCADLQELITLCGGKVVKSSKRAKIIVGQFIDDENVICVREKWILESITENRKKSLKHFLLHDI